MAPQDSTDLDQLIKNADLAMYGAKADGRRTYRFFEPAMDARAKARLTMERDLRQGAGRRRLPEIHYQPLVDLRSDEVTGCEALLRWWHPERGMVSPAEFIPIAEDTGLIIELGEWVLRAACAEASILGPAPYPPCGQCFAGSVEKPDAGAEDRKRAGELRPARQPAGDRNH